MSKKCNDCPEFPKVKPDAADLAIAKVKDKTVRKALEELAKKVRWAAFQPPYDN